MRPKGRRVGLKCEGMNVATHVVAESPVHLLVLLNEVFPIESAGSDLGREMLAVVDVIHDDRPTVGQFAQ